MLRLCCTQELIPPTFRFAVAVTQDRGSGKAAAAACGVSMAWGEHRAQQLTVAVQPAEHVEFAVVSTHAKVAQGLVRVA
eukprot:3140329-Rhodomonas_salina.4